MGEASLSGYGPVGPVNRLERTRLMGGVGGWGRKIPVHLHAMVILRVKIDLTKTHIVCINTHMDSRMIIKILKKDGWFKVDQSGSHIQFKHPSKKGRVTIPHPKKDIPIGTLKSIERQAGIKLK